MAGFDTYQAFTDVHGLGRDPNPALGYNYGLSTQQHVDVRTFIEAAWAATKLSGPPGVPTITTGPQTSYNKWPGASVFAPTGSSRYTSSYTTPINLLMLGVDALLTIALPDIPAGHVDLANSAVEFSSDSFATVLSIPWSTSTTDPVATHRLTFALALSTTVDLTQINGVRLVITTTLNTTLTIMAMRVIDPQWVALNVDFENISGRLRQTIPLDGNPLTVPDSSHTLPLMWFASNLPGVADPRPIDSEYGFVINTGSQAKVNAFSLFMRENTKAFTTQLDLQGTPQNTLTGHPQPIINTGMISKLPRPMADLDRYTMSELENNSMSNLEAVGNPAYSSWIRFAVTWGTTPGVQITNSANLTGGFQYSGMTFTNNTSYLVVCSLVQSTARLQLYNIDQSTLAMQGLIFDTMAIPDSFLFPRRAGRIGFQALINDGDAYVGAIRPRSLMFAEYRSAPLRSITPVKGARLYTQSTPPIELFGAWFPLSDGNLKLPTLTSDQQRFVVDDDSFSTKVTVITPSTVDPPQGIVSNVLSSDAWSGITDFDELHIEFFVWMPSAAINNGVNGPAILTAQLVNLAQSNTLDYADAGLFAGPAVILPVIKPDQWQKVSIYRPVPKPYPVSGPYRLALFYHGQTSATWWVDGASVHEHVVHWDARSVVDDPWLSNDAPWTGFHEVINSDVNGVQFTTQGTELQMRGMARQQDVAIVGTPKLVPQYAELGKLVWSEDSIPMAALPIATITSSFIGRAYSFGVTGVVGAANYQWSFGDGTFAAGPIVTHTYSAAFAAGTQFTVYLTLYDQMGQTNSVSTLVTLA